MIDKVVETQYDGWIIVKRKGDLIIDAYEGLINCPLKVKNYIKKNGCQKVPFFRDEYVAFGLMD